MGGIVIPKTEKNQHKPNGYERLRTFLNNNSGILIAIQTVLTTGVIILLIILLLRQNATTATKPGTSELPINITSKNPVRVEELTADLSDNLTLVSRREWLATEPVENSTALGTPVQYVIIQHTASESCSSQDQCIFHVRFIQTFHMENNAWWDIGYNFLVGGDGKAYEGRGWTLQGAHTYGYNARSIGIAFIGTFNNVKPPQRQIRACQLLIEKGVELGHIKEDYKLLAARQLKDTESPGALLYEDIKTWDHWVKMP